MAELPVVKRLRKDMDNLKRELTVELPKELERARAHGDLSENAEYHAAKERQAFIEGRAVELEDKLSRAEIIDISKLSGNSVTFGATVTLVDEDTRAKNGVDANASYQPHANDDLGDLYRPPGHDDLQEELRL